MARSNLSARAWAEIRLARKTCAENRIIALRAAIADGSYRVDPHAIAARLIAAVHFPAQSPTTH